jgi:hypothetical protein
MTPELHAMIARGSTYIEVASAYEIADHETAQQAAEELGVIMRAIAELKAGKASFVKPAKDIIANAEKWFDPGIEGFEAAAAMLKGRLLEYQQNEQARIAVERAAREAEERRVRQEAEEAAAIARAKAEEIAREERRKAEAAEQARAQAEASGNAKAAARAAAEAAKATERAQAAIENGNAAAQEALVSAVAESAAPIAEPTRIVGFTTRKNWKAELKAGITEDQAKALILVAAASRPELLALFDLNQSRLDKWAKAQEAAMNVPGYSARNVPIAAGSKR